MSASADRFLAAARRVPQLSAEQEIELGRAVRAWQDWPGGPDQAPAAIQRKGQQALDRFLISNIRLAHWAARKFRGTNVSLEDLTQAALLGLRTGYLRWQPQLGYRTSSYVIWYAMQACRKIIAEQGTGIHLPVTLADLLRRITRLADEHRSTYGTPPSDQDIEEAAGMQPGSVNHVRRVAQMADLLSLEYENGESGTLHDHLATPESPMERLEAEDEHQRLRELVATSSVLTVQQRYILQCRYLNPEPLTVTKVASQLNLHRNRVRSLEKAALEALRELLQPGANGSMTPASQP